jgi:hypothetical protein
VLEIQQNSQQALNSMPIEAETMHLVQEFRRGGSSKGHGAKFGHLKEYFYTYHLINLWYYHVL